MNQTLTDMSITEAASKALEILLVSCYTGYYNAEAEEYLKAELEIDQFSDLDNTIRAWSQVKGELYGDKKKATLDNFTAELVAEYGGEGQGDQYWVVISLSDGKTTRYFRKDGWYASYSGGELDGDTYEVTPQERMVVFYE